MVNCSTAEQSPCGCDLYVLEDLYVRQKRVNHTAAEKGPCGCDLYVRQKRVNCIKCG